MRVRSREFVAGGSVSSGCSNSTGKSDNRGIGSSGNRVIGSSGDRVIGESADRGIGESADRGIGESGTATAASNRAAVCVGAIATRAGTFSARASWRAISSGGPISRPRPETSSSTSVSLAHITRGEKSRATASSACRSPSGCCNRKQENRSSEDQEISGFCETDLRVG
jgi:hypothetical protein